MFKHWINAITICGFTPFLVTFYLLDNGLHQLALTVVYFAVLAIAIKIN